MFDDISVVKLDERKETDPMWIPAHSPGREFTHVAYLSADKDLHGLLDVILIIADMALITGYTREQTDSQHGYHVVWFTTRENKDELN